MTTTDKPMNDEYFSSISQEINKNIADIFNKCTEEFTRTFQQEMSNQTQRIKNTLTKPMKGMYDVKPVDPKKFLGDIYHTFIDIPDKYKDKLWYVFYCVTHKPREPREPNEHRYNFLLNNGAYFVLDVTCGCNNTSEELRYAEGGWDQLYVSGRGSVSQELIDLLSAMYCRGLGGSIYTNNNCIFERVVNNYYQYKEHCVDDMKYILDEKLALKAERDQLEKEKVQLQQEMDQQKAALQQEREEFYQEKAKYQEGVDNWEAEKAVQISELKKKCMEEVNERFQQNLQDLNNQRQKLDELKLKQIKANKQKETELSEIEILAITKQEQIDKQLQEIENTKTALNIEKEEILNTRKILREKQAKSQQVIQKYTSLTEKFDEAMDIEKALEFIRMCCDTIDGICDLESITESEIEEIQSYRDAISDIIYN